MREPESRTARGVGQSLLRGLVQALFPPLCVGCQAGRDSFLCAGCRARLKANRSLVAGEQLLVLGDYEGCLQACLAAIKHQGHRALAAELAQLCAQRIAQAWGQVSSMQVYSIKPSRAGHRYRGFSLPAMMEKAVLSRTGWTPLPEALAAQFPSGQASSRGMNLEERLQRQQSLHESAQARAPETTARGPLLILDDVVTTGATMGSTVVMARALGFAPLHLFAVAVAEAPT